MQTPPATANNNRNVLKPFVTDFWFSPMITEVDRIPRPTNPKITRSPAAAMAGPMPMQTKTKPMPISAKKNSPGAKSSCSFALLEFAIVVLSV